MKSFLTAAALTVVLLLVLFPGCELVTNEPTGLNRVIGTDLIIDQVFMISPEKYYAYSWIQFLNPTDHRIQIFDTTLPASGYAMGDGGTFLYTTDDGATWTPQTEAPSSNINSMTNPYPDSGYLCGDNGLLMRTLRDTLGVHFQPWNSPGSVNLNSITVVPLGRLGYVGGDGGNLWRTANSGLLWTKQTLGTTQNIHRLYLVDIRRTYLCGDSGQVWKTEKANQWQDKSPSGFSAINFYSIAFVQDTGLVVGDKGRILYSENGANSWTPETSGVNLGLHGLFMADPNGEKFHRGEGWIVGDSGVVLRTEDNGKTRWWRYWGGTYNTLRSVIFTDSLRGWAFGDHGTIVATTNGGVAWHPLESGTTADLNWTVFLPLLIKVQSSYTVTMRVRRNQVYYDPNLPPDFVTNPNLDVIVARDTGVIAFVPGLTIGGGSRETPSVPAGGFAIISSDSAKFQDHTQLGPGQTKFFNASFFFGLDSVGNWNGKFYKWDLLPSSEIRVYKFFSISTRVPPVRFLGGFNRLLDVVRWGNYRPSPDDYPNNTPAPFIPDGWALARYNNDVGGDPTVANTKNSFYLTSTPVPGWYTQLRR